MTGRKPTLMLILFSLWLINIALGQDFKPVPPNTAKLKKMSEKSDASEMMGYRYLLTYYKAVSDKDSIEYYENSSPKSICAFKQIFENNIVYSTWSCKEAGGIGETLSFPRTDLKIMQSFIETLFYDKENSWTTDFKYEPEGAGCYYEIKQTDKRTIIDIYCGC